ncbi:MAG: ABC transporter permease [Chloroflexota bacterium]
MVLPVITLGIALMASVMRMTRSGMLEVMHQDYIRTARAKGAREQRVIFAHAFRNAMLPVLTIIGLQLGALLGGAVVIEQIFSLPGMGRLGLMPFSFAISR